MGKVVNLYGVDTRVHYRKDGKISLRLEFLPTPEAYKALRASSLGGLMATAIDIAMKNPVENRTETRRSQAKITG